MHRVFGRSQPKAPAPNITDAAANLDSRIETLDKKINLQRQEIGKYQQQMRTMKEGPAKNSLKQRALRVLREVKTLEKQRDCLSSQSSNMCQASFAIQSAKDTQTMVAAMQVGVKEFKKESKKINIDKIEDLMDDMSDMVELNDEFGEVLSRSVCPVDFDEADLDAELEALGEDYGASFDNAYLDEAINAPGVPSTAVGVPSALPAAPSSANGIALDEFGLPQIPQN